MATREYFASPDLAGASITRLSGTAASASRSRRNRTSLLPLGPLLVAALSSGCGIDEPAPAGGGELAVPPFVASSRAIDTELLSVTMTVGGPVDEGGTAVIVTRSGDTYTARFRLLDDGEYPLDVLWSYAASGRASPIPIAETSSTVSLANTRRTIRVEGYRTRAFDEDGDGRDNFTEIDEGTDPLVSDSSVPVAPRASDQDDCRMTRLPGEPADEASAPRDLFRFGGAPFSETRALQFETERHIYYATFFLETGGDILIEHRSGLPTNTNAIFYDRRAGAVGFDNSANISVLANPGDTSDGIPARVAARIPEPGLYCYALLDENAPDIATGPALTDIVLLIEFTPGTP